MNPTFHLSISVISLKESLDFFVHLLNAKIQHSDPSGYVNIDFFGSQITLKQSSTLAPHMDHFHFGINLSLIEFEKLSENIFKYGQKYITMQPKVFDPGTPLERKKMYLKCPTGYALEIKGYK